MRRRAFKNYILRVWQTCASVVPTVLFTRWLLDLEDDALLIRAWVTLVIALGVTVMTYLAYSTESDK
jgi:hypothetical protein